VTGDACGRGRTRRDTENHSRTPDVSVYARLGDPEEAGDLLRRKTARDRAEDLALTIGQRGHGPRAPREDALRDEVYGKNPDQRGSRAPHPYGERPRLAL